jgi:dATP pyrophosphohydrolase
MRKTREAAIFVYRGDRFLVTRRRDGIWNVPAGQIEDGESFADGAARELMEETGLAAPLIDLDVRDAYEVEPRFRALYAPGEYSVTVVAYAAEAPEGWEPTLNHEHTEYRWCAFDDALTLLHWPETKGALRVLGQRLGL